MFTQFVHRNRYKITNFRVHIQLRKSQLGRNSDKPGMVYVSTVLKNP